jgi:hypothetical protein
MAKDNDKDGNKLWNAVRDIAKGALLGYLSAAPKGEEGELVKKFKETTLGKAFVVASGKLGTRVGVIVATSIALAAISGPAAAVPLAFGLGAVAVGVVADTMDVRNTRLLKKENDNLVRFVDSKLIEKEIFAKNIELEQIFGGKLNKLGEKNFKDKTLNAKFSKATDITGRISDNFGHFGDAAAALVKLDFGGLASSLTAGITKLVTGGNRSDTKNDVRKGLEAQIDLLRKHDMTPGYSSSFELRGAVRNQRIQQMALQKLLPVIDELKNGDNLKKISSLTKEELQVFYDKQKKKIDTLKEDLNKSEKDLDTLKEGLKKIAPTSKNKDEIAERKKKITELEEKIAELEKKIPQREKEYNEIIKCSTGEEVVQTKFNQLKTRIEKTEQAVARTGVGHAVKSFFNDMRRSHDPHSQYYSQSSVKFDAIVQKIGEEGHKVKTFTGKKFKKHQEKVQTIEAWEAKQQVKKGEEPKIDNRQPTIVKLPNDKGKKDTNIPDEHRAEAAKKIAKIKKHSPGNPHHGPTKTSQDKLNQNSQGQGRGTKAS